MNETHWDFLLPCIARCQGSQGARVRSPRLFGQRCFTKLHKLFGLHVDVDHRLLVAKDVSSFLELVDGIY
jgi:hypothetical protein